MSLYTEDKKIKEIQELNLKYKCLRMSTRLETMEKDGRIKFLTEINQRLIEENKTITTKTDKIIQKKDIWKKSKKSEKYLFWNVAKKKF